MWITINPLEGSLLNNQFNGKQEVFSWLIFWGWWHCMWTGAAWFNGQTLIRYHYCGTGWPFQSKPPFHWLFSNNSVSVHLFMHHPKLMTLPASVFFMTYLYLKTTNTWSILWVWYQHFDLEFLGQFLLWSNRAFRTCSCSTRWGWISQKDPCMIHPWRLTAGTYSHHPFRNEHDLNQSSMIMFHVNLQGWIWSYIFQ